MALPVKALDMGCPIAFIIHDDLIKILKTSEISAASKRRIRVINNTALVVINEVGFLPFTPAEANLFFSFISSMTENTSLIITSNKEFDEKYST